MLVYNVFLSTFRDLDVLPQSVEISDEWLVLTKSLEALKVGVNMVLLSDKKLEDAMDDLVNLAIQYNKNVQIWYVQNTNSIDNQINEKLSSESLLNSIITNTKDDNFKSILEKLRDALAYGHEMQTIGSELYLDGLRNIDLNTSNLFDLNSDESLRQQFEEKTTLITSSKQLSEIFVEAYTLQNKLLTSLTAAYLLIKNFDKVRSEFKVIDVTQCIMKYAVEYRDYAVIVNHLLTALKHGEKGIRRIERFAKIRETNYPRFENLVKLKLSLKACHKAAEAAGLSDMTMEEINAEVKAYRRGE